MELVKASTVKIDPVEDLQHSTYYVNTDFKRMKASRDIMDEILGDFQLQLQEGNELTIERGAYRIIAAGFSLIGNVDDLEESYSDLENKIFSLPLERERAAKNG